MVERIVTCKLMALAEWEVSILRTLLQDHMNTISEISSHYVHAETVEYTDSLHTLEQKLITAENA